MSLIDKEIPAVASEAFWLEVRAAYPRQKPLLNLNNAAVRPPPLAVEQAVIDAYRLVSRNPDVNNVEQARRRAARHQG